MQQAEQQGSRPDQDSHMKPADGQQVGNSQPGKRIPVFRGNQGTLAQQQRRGISAGFFPHPVNQHCGQPMTDGSGGTRKGKEGRIGYRQVFLPVKPDIDAVPEQFLPEIISVGIDGTGRMVQPGPEGNHFSRFQSGRKPFIFRKVESPVRAAGMFPAVERNMGELDADLAKMAGTDFIGNDALYIIICLGRQGRMPGQAAGRCSDSQRQEQACDKAQ